MGILERFFGRKSGASGGLVAATVTGHALSLQLLFSTKARLEAAAITETLRAFDPSTAKGTCEIDGELSEQGTPIGLIGWGSHVVRLVGFDVPMPADVVELCVGPSHYGPDLKARARSHESHLILYYAGREASKVEQYVALAVVAAVMSQHGAIVVTNESGHTSFPAQALFGDDDRIELLRELPLPILYCGFVKLEVEGVAGVWMRTYGGNLLDIPDFAQLVEGHQRGEETMFLIGNIMSYLLSSGAKLAAGHTMEAASDLVIRLRSPTRNEHFLESPGELLVIEEIPADQANRH
jgi:hypothetical protein